METAFTILFVDNSFTFGGAIISLKTTVQALDKVRFRPVLVTAQDRSYLSKHFPDIEWRSLNMKLPWIHNRFYRKLSALPFFKNNAFMRKILNKSRSLLWAFCFTLPEAYKIYRIGRKHGVSLVHLNNAIGSQLSAVIAAKLLRVPCVAHLRCYEQPCRSAMISASLVDHHIAVSESVKKNLFSLGVNKEKISVIHDAVDLSVFPNNIEQNVFGAEKVFGESPLIGWFGRIVRWKGLHEFIISINELYKKFKEFRVIIVGDNSDSGNIYYEEAKRLTNSLGLKDKITFAGYKENVLPFMKSMDIIAHTSVTPEPFGMVIIEAMACGKPVVASVAGGGGPLEIVKDGETGFLVDPKDPEKMSEVFQTLLKDEALRGKMGRAGRKRVESMFESSIHARKIEKIYQKLI